ncbi:peptide deformylase [Thermodesulfobacteriota bacterium]
MAILEIKTYPDKFLMQPTNPVEKIDKTIQKTIDDMAATMYAAPGAGLAAIQIGCDKSILVYDISPREENQSLQVLINPRIVSSEGVIISENEGCLSVPDLRADVKRATKIVVEGLDREGNPLKIEADGYPAIVLQHELDHLNGILFIDHISALKRGLYKKRIKKKLM